MADESFEDSERTREEEDEFKFSEKGKRMAASLAEYILMRYFFPGVDRKKQQKHKDFYMEDMEFNLANGQVKRATEKLKHRPFLDKVYSLFRNKQRAEEEIKVGLSLLDDCKFTHERLQNFTIDDKIELLNGIKIEKRSAGSRLFPETASSNLNSFVLVLKGKIGIFHIDPHLKALQKHPGRVVACSQLDLPKRKARLLRNMHMLLKQKEEREELQRQKLKEIEKPLTKREKAILDYKNKVSGSLNMCDRFLEYSRVETRLREENPLFNIQKSEILKESGLCESKKLVAQRLLSFNTGVWNKQPEIIPEEKEEEADLSPLSPIKQ